MDALFIISQSEVACQASILFGRFFGGSIPKLTHAIGRIPFLTDGEVRPPISLLAVTWGTVYSASRGHLHSFLKVPSIASLEMAHPFSFMLQISLIFFSVASQRKLSLQEILQLVHPNSLPILKSTG